MASRRTNLIAIVLGLGLGVWIIIQGETAPPDDQPEPPAPPDPSLSARGACREFVTRVLNDPASAEWEPGRSWVVEDRGEGRWFVQPVLRAKNAFGALILTRFDCEVQITDGEVRLVSLNEE